MCPVEVEQIEAGTAASIFWSTEHQTFVKGTVVDVPQGALVNMLAKPERRSYFIHWDGVCDTGPRKEPCDFTVAKAALQVSARIGPRLCSGDFCTGWHTARRGALSERARASSERDVAVGNGRPSCITCTMPTRSL